MKNPDRVAMEQRISNLAKRWDVAPEFVVRVKGATNHWEAHSIVRDTIPGTPEHKVACGNLRRRCRDLLRLARECGRPDLARSVELCAPVKSRIAKAAVRLHLRLTARHAA